MALQIRPTPSSFSGSIVIDNPPSAAPLSSSSGPSGLHATTGRRQLIAQLLRFQELIKVPDPHQDEIGHELKEWNDRFLEAVRSHHDIERVKEEFLTVLEELLIDPFNVPLRQDVLLGSDGKSYGKKPLSLYLHSVPDELKHRPPLSDPEGPRASFITTPHPIIPSFVDWLAEQRSLPPLSEALETAYEELVRQDQLPTIPTIKSERIRLLQEKRKQKEQEKQAESERLAQRLSVLSTQIAERVHQEFAALHERVDETSRRQFAQIEELDARDRERLEPIERDIVKLENETKQLEQKNEQLKLAFVLTEKTMKEVERQDARLAISINETRIAIQKRKARERRAAWNAVAVVGLCFLGGCAIGSILNAAGAASAGVSATVTPAAGGAKVGLAIAF